MTRMLPLFLLLGGCARNDGVAAWAMDPVWIEPDGAVDIHGFQTWEMYSSHWTKNYHDKFYVCSVLVELYGTPGAPGDACADCTQTWDVDTSVLETDCYDQIASDPGWLSLSRVGIGPVASEISADDPFPAQSHGGYADYSTGQWVSHGWAYPESLDNRGQADDLDWNGTQPFTLWPAYVWNLGG